MKIRTLVLCSLLTLVTAALPVAAQAPAEIPAPPTPTTIWDFLTTGTNYSAEVFGTFAPDGYKLGVSQFGGGLAVIIKATEFLTPIIRLQYSDSQIYAVSGGLSLQPPRSLMGKLPFTPYAEVAAATSLSGLANQNGSAIGIVGSGVLFDLNWIGSSWLWQHTKIDVAYEHWFPMPAGHDNYLLFGTRVSF